MNLFKRFTNWFNRQNTGNKIAITGLIITAISSIILPVVLYLLKPDTGYTPSSQINSPVINQAPNSSSEITYNTNNNVIQGADPRDVEAFLKRLTPGAKAEKYRQIDSFYENKEINSELKDTLYTIVDYMDSNLQSTDRQIASLQTNGSIKLASSLSKINTAYARSDLNSVITITDQETVTPDTSSFELYLNTASKLMNVQRYGQAESYYQKAISLQEQSGLQNTPDYANSLNELAKLYRTQGKYDLAEPLHQQVKQIWGSYYGTNSSEYATALSELATFYDKQGRYDLAEPMFKEALAIHKITLGANSSTYAIDLNNLALLYEKQGKYDLAEPMYKEALKIDKNISGIDSTDYAIDLNNLALLYDKQDLYDLAEPLYRESLSIIKPILGNNHPTTTTIINNLNKLQKAKSAFN